MDGLDPVWDTASRSPNGIHVARLRYVDEIPWGERYYHLEFDDRKFGSRIFTDRLLWSPTSRFLAIEEWFFTRANYPWPIRARLVMLSSADPSVEHALVELFHGDDPASLRKGYPVIEPLEWTRDVLIYETLAETEEGKVVRLSHDVVLPEAARPTSGS
jgi:hypothetical protein